LISKSVKANLIQTVITICICTSMGFAATTPFVNSTLNIQYIPPPGWSYSVFSVDTFTAYKALTLHITNPNNQVYPNGIISLFAYKCSSAQEAAYIIQSQCFHQIKSNAANVAGTNMHPTILRYVDTTLNNTTYAYFAVTDMFSIWTKFIYACSNGSYVQEMIYNFQLPTDLAKCDSVFYQNWLATNFISFSTMAMNKRQDGLINNTIIRGNTLTFSNEIEAQQTKVIIHNLLGGKVVEDLMKYRNGSTYQIPSLPSGEYLIELKSKTLNNSIIYSNIKR
jgi:hypothetical protein